MAKVSRQESAIRDPWPGGSKDGEVVAKGGRRASSRAPAPGPKHDSWASTLTAMEAAGVSGGVLPECNRKRD